MKKTQKWLGLLLPVVVAAGLIFAANFAAVKYCYLSGCNGRIAISFLS